MALVEETEVLDLAPVLADGAHELIRPGDGIRGSLAPCRTMTGALMSSAKVMGEI